MKASVEPLVLNRNPHVGDPHPHLNDWRVVNVRTILSADIEGKIVYLGPQEERMEAMFILKPA